MIILDVDWTGLNRNLGVADSFLFACRVPGSGYTEIGQNANAALSGRKHTFVLELNKTEGRTDSARLSLNAINSGLKDLGQDSRAA